MTEFPGEGAGQSNVPAGPPPGALPYSYPPGGYGAPPQPYPGFMPPPTRRGNPLGTASLVVGFAALVATVTLFGGAILGITAVVMGVVARRRVKHGEAAGGGAELVGIVLGLIAVVASAFLIWLAYGTELFNEDYQHCLGEHNGMAHSCDQYR